ncbi:MAG: tetratricopeptide repeat protein [Thermoanaerobaculia bacterium]
MNRSMAAIASDPRDRARGGSLAPGGVLAGRYRVVAFLGRGAVGEVYEALDQELGDAIAVKILRPEIARDERALHRFRREIQLARRVTHPNVCRVFDLVHHTSPAGDAPPADQVFLTMELLRGETLEQLLARQGRMSTAEALPVIGHIVAALTAAHANGVVHRDLKSGNVFLVPEASGTRAVVTDFGLAWSSIETDDSASLTATGELVGSPAYMAPEQVRGEEATPATDIYALGVVIFEMVTGELPFVGKSAFYTALKRLQEPAPSPRLHLSDLDPAWEKMILRCLERDPAKRFPSVRHVLRALGLTKAEEDATSPVRLIESRVRQLRRRRRMALELGAVALFLAASGLWWAWRTGRLGSHAAPAATAQTSIKPGPAVAMRPLVAVLPFENLAAGPESPQSRVFFELLPLELAASGTVRVVPAEEVDEALRDLAAADPARPDDLRLRQRLGADFLVTGAYLPGTAGTRWDVILRGPSGTKTFSANGGEALESLPGKLRQALGAKSLAAGEAEALRGLQPEPEAAVLWAEGLHRLRRGEAPAARDLLRRAVAAVPDNPLLHSALAEVWTDLGYVEEAQKEARQAFSLAAVLGRDERLSLEARYHEAAGEWADAAASWKQIADASPDDLATALRLVDAYEFAGKIPEAEARLVRLHHLPEPAGSDPRLDLAESESASVRSDFGWAEKTAGRAVQRAEARGALKLAAQSRIAETRALLGLHDLGGAGRAAEQARRGFSAVGDERGAAQAARALAQVHFQSGNMDGARADYAAALALYQRLGLEGKAAKTLREAGNLHNAVHDLDRAEAYYRQAGVLAARVGDRQAEAAVLHNRANLMRQQGRLQEAKTLFRQALNLHREIGYVAGEAATLQGLAFIAVREGNLLEARAAYQQALALYPEKFDERGAEVLNNLAEVSFQLGELALSRQQREQARAISQFFSEHDGIARADGGIASVLRQQGDLAAARGLFEQSLATYQQLKLPAKQAEISDAIGVTLGLQGDLMEALKRFQEALGLVRQQGDASAEAMVLANQGRALWRWGDLQGAAAALVRALSKLREIGQGFELADALVTLGNVQRDQGDLAAAWRSFEEALAISRRCGTRSTAAAALDGLGSLHLRRGEPASARKRYVEALAIQAELGEKLTAAESRLALAEVTLAEKRPAQAETDTRAAAAEFQALDNAPGQCAAALLLARCLLAQNKTAQAGEVLSGAARLLDASQEPAVRKAAAELRARTVGVARRNR